MMFHVQHSQARHISSRMIWYVFAASSSIVGLLSALLIRFDFSLSEVSPNERLAYPLYTLVAARVLAFYLLALDRTSWRHSSLRDLLKILKVQILSSVFFAAILTFLKIQYFPRSVVLIEFLVSTGFILTSKLLYRMISEGRVDPADKATKQKCVVIGGGDSGHRLIRILQANHPNSFGIVAVFDDNLSLRNNTVHGIPVLGAIADISAYLDSSPDIHSVLIAIPSLSESKTELIVRSCLARNVECKRLRTIDDLAVESIYVSPASADSLVELLLEKEHAPKLEPHTTSLLISQHSILITGAGGSIGSEIVRQICDLSPRRVICVENSEYNLFKLENEIRERFPSIDCVCLLGDIRDRDRMFSVFKELTPDLVFHAAAYKHVPLTERNPFEAFSTNVFGTLNVCEAAKQGGCKRFVMISTDKAVSPVNILGYTKRIAELLVRALGEESKNGAFLASSVRFGNVINSTGSVIPTFRSQILQGNPITVTHPDVERYFMTTKEAVRLVLSATQLAAKGDIFFLDMGKRVKILDVAERMRSLFGRRDIPIVFTGLRPGERLYEETASNSERVSDTEIERVKHLTQPPVPYSFIQRLQLLRSNFSTLSEQEIREVCRELCELSQ